MKNKSHSVSVKLTAPLVLMGALAVLQFSYLLYDLSVIKQSIEEKTNAVSNIELLSFTLSQRENNLRSLLFEFYVSKDAEIIKSIKKERVNILGTLDKLKTFSHSYLINYDIDTYLSHRGNLVALSDRFISSVIGGNELLIENTFNQWRIKEQHINSLHTDLIGNMYNLNHAFLAELKSSQKSQTTLFSIFILMNLILIGSAYFISRIIVTKPLIELKNATKRMEEGNYDIGISSKANDEIGSLFRSFNSMSKSVHNFNVELESMVDTRTAELELEVAQRKDAEETLQIKMVELERSNRDLAQFAYVASHDLQEPLRMVASYTQLIEQRYAEKLDQDGKEFIGFAVEGAVRMQKLIKDLLEYSRVNRKELDLSAVNIGQTLECIERNLTFLLAQSSGEIQFSEEINEIEVVTDESLLMLLLQNLIANGLKFQKDSPAIITVKVLSNSDHWHVSVTDNGIGIKEEFQARIFKVFQRLHSRTEYEGNGMGLSICHSIAERLGGKIWVDSIFGQGSTFHFTIEKKSLLAIEKENSDAEIYQNIAS
ncbi:ATP-binding protein [Vibrio kyushuensis]|uniref:sensor histidine kinase n=1 Tax=Vibrio kyushuensis TaxID=2910249 RepID=UPI003D0C9F17